jgi:hypothetical protein
LKEIGDIRTTIKKISSSLGFFGTAALPLLKKKKEQRKYAEGIRNFMSGEKKEAKIHNDLVKKWREK